jgi:enoyl-CoA hydratase/carnithine racemase
MSPKVVHEWLPAAAGARPHPLSGEFQRLDLSLLDASADGSADGAVACVGLNRPRRRNALDRDAWVEIGRFFSAAAQASSPPCRAVLLYGRGGDFCSGIDVTDRRFPVPTTTAAQGGGGSGSPASDPARAGLAFLPALEQMQDCFTALEECGIPIVAAVHGRCLGAGVDLACAADVVWCTADAVFSIREVALGLAADVGTLQRLPKRAGNHSLVRELCLTGRDFGAAEAERMGLVGRVCPTREALMQEAVALCRRIASHSPVAVQGTKRAILYARDRPVADGLRQVAQYNALALQSPDARTAMASALSRRRREYPDLLTPSKL